MTKIQGLKPSPKTILEGEVWLEIPEYPNYEVSSFGRVYSRKYKRIMSPSKKDDGGRMVKLRKRGLKVKANAIHRLVAKAFIPNPENKPAVDHIDCNRSNNHVSNLQWCTLGENTHYAYLRGRDRKYGERSSMGKLTNEQANQVRQWFQSKEKTVKQMSSEFSISEQSLRAIIKNQTYPCTTNTMQAS
jgi:hypothetical protein